MRLQGKVALITGAARGQGAAEARLFAREGAKVVLADVLDQDGSGVAAEIAEAGGDAVYVHLDVTNEQDWDAAMQSAVSRFGKIDILVNNAAITDHKNILDISEEEFDQVIGVTLKGPFLVAKFVAEQMVKQGRGGKIVNIASTSGLQGRTDAVAYSAAKGGVLNLSRAMAVQLSPYKIRVNCVTPNRSGSPVGQNEGVVGREFKNLAGRLGNPEDQARTVFFLASDESDFVWGANLICDGGVTAASNFPRDIRR